MSVTTRKVELVLIKSEEGYDLLEHYFGETQSSLYLISKDSQIIFAKFNFVEVDKEFIRLVQEKYSKKALDLFDSLNNGEYFYIVDVDNNKKFLKIKDANNDDCFVDVTDGGWDLRDWFVDDFTDYSIELIPEEKQEVIRNFLKNV